MTVNALVKQYGSYVNCIKTPVKIINLSNGKESNSLAIWDTGATNCVITKSMAQNFGLIPVSKTVVNGVHGQKEVNVYYVKIILNNENITLSTRVTECEELSSSHDTGMLIGMDLIQKGDFCISNFSGNTVMTFRVPSLECIDFVEEIRLHNKYLKIHELNVKKNIADKCGCGSGKLYKNCHGNSPYSSSK